MNPADPLAAQWPSVHQVVNGPTMPPPWAAAPPQPEPEEPARMKAAHKVLVGVVAAGVVAISALGFAGSYTAVRDLAAARGFGAFANYFPLGVDAGIAVFLALDLLLTWLRMPYPLLRQAAWGLTAATISFNAAAAWPDPLGVGMHATIPLLFIIAVEAARHAIGRIANIVADKHMESPRLVRWLLAPAGTARIWRRQRLWELRSYEQVIALEREALVFRTQLRATHGPRWRRNARPEELLALKLARFGVPVGDTLATANQPAEPAANPVANQGDNTPEPVREPQVQAAPEPEAKQQRTSPRRTGSRTRPAKTGKQVREPAPGSDVASPAEQVHGVLNLIKKHGYDAVNLGFVMDETGMKKTTAYNRLVEARAVWSEDRS